MFGIKNYLISKLKSNFPDNFHLELRLIIQNVKNISNEDFVSLKDINLSKKEIKEVEKLINKRVNGLPLSYITGKKEFYSLEFLVDKNTLIPRPETELIIDYVIKNHCPVSFKKLYDLSSVEKIRCIKKLNFLDLGTGSGNIIITLMKFFVNSTALAVDISEKALEIAQKNAILHKVDDRITFIKSDFFENIENDIFDVIVSNPPYISAKSKDISKSVKKYEPKQALFSKNNGLADIYKILDHAPDYMNKNSVLLIENGFDQMNDIKNYICDKKINIYEIIKDYNQIERLGVYKKLDLKRKIN